MAHVEGVRVCGLEGAGAEGACGKRGARVVWAALLP